MIQFSWCTNQVLHVVESKSLAIKFDSVSLPCGEVTLGQFLQQQPYCSGRLLASSRLLMGSLWWSCATIPALFQGLHISSAVSYWTTILGHASHSGRNLWTKIIRVTLTLMGPFHWQTRTLRVQILRLRGVRGPLNYLVLLKRSHHQIQRLSANVSLQTRICLCATNASKILVQVRSILPGPLPQVKSGACTKDAVLILQRRAPWVTFIWGLLQHFATTSPAQTHQSSGMSMIWLMPCWVLNSSFRIRTHTGSKRIPVRWSSSQRMRKRKPQKVILLLCQTHRLGPCGDDHWQLTSRGIWADWPQTFWFTGRNH